MCIRDRADVTGGAGIGSGENADYTGTITISGGVVYAVGGADSLSIGGGGRGVGPVSYTHLDVYKRQHPGSGCAVILSDGPGGRKTMCAGAQFAGRTCWATARAKWCWTKAVARLLP